MRFEKIKPQNESFIGTDDLSHGIDERENSQCRLTDAVNVMLNGKAAVSRKGMVVEEDTCYFPYSYNTAKALPYSHELFIGGEYKKIVVLRESDDATYATYAFRLMSHDNYECDLGSINFTPATFGSIYEPISMIVFSGNKTQGEGIYALFGFVDILDEYYMKMYEYSSSGEWVRLDDDDMYAPVIYKNGRGASYSFSEKEFDAPVFVEKPNMLCNKTKYYYNADGVSGIFFIPIDEIKYSDDNYIKCNVEIEDGEVLQFTISGEDVTSAPVSHEGENLTISINRRDKKLQFDNFTPPYIWQKENTIEVIVSQENSENLKRISNMQFGIWYNSGASGTRFFAAGNSFYPSLLCASTPDNPLYFPEDEQYFVGDPSQKITALARQNRSLVVFKEKEIYCGSYTSKKFTVSHLHSAIGCDLPATVTLCGNRVVWATTDKCIYTLNALSDYGAVAVYRISSAINDKLHKLDFTDACAVYKDDVYYLFLKQKTCIMNVSGALLQSNKQFLESAAFTFWELPESVKVQSAMAVYDGLRLICSTENDNGQILYVSSVSGDSSFDEVMYRDAEDANLAKEPFYSVLKFCVNPGISFAENSFYKAYIRCFAENGVDIAYSNETGDILKNSRIDLKYTGIKLAAPYRLMPLMSGAALLLDLKASGEFIFSGCSVYYKPFV